MDILGNMATEQVLAIYGTVEGLSIQPMEPVDFNDWVDDLSPAIRAAYSFFEPDGLITTEENISNRGSSKAFSYDPERFNPLHLEKNLNRALILLEDCYSLRNRVAEVRYKIEEQKAQIEFANSIAVEQAKEDEFVISDLKSIGAAIELKIHQSADGANSKITPKSVSDERVTKLVGIRKQIRNLEKLERERISNAAEDSDSPYNFKIQLSRIQGRYLDRRTDLVSLTEACAHGLLMIYGQNIKDIGVDRELGPEDAIRQRLTEISRRLEVRHRSDEDYVLPLSLRTQKINLGEDFLVNSAFIDGSEARFNFTKSLIKFSLDTNDFLDDDRIFPRLRGTAIELVTDDPNDNGEVWKVRVTPPLQPSGYDSPTKFIKIDPVIVSTRIAIFEESVSNPRNFFGENTLRNVNPMVREKDWIIEVAGIRNDGANQTNRPIKDILLHLHLTTQSNTI